MSPSSRIRAHIRSNVVGYVALFFALSMGTAYATHPGGADTISSGDIINREVKTPDIEPNAVTTGRIADGGVRAPDIRNAAVGSGKIRNGGVQNSDLATDSVDSAKVADESLGAADLGADSVGPTEIQQAAVGPGKLQGDSVGSLNVVDESLTGDDVDESKLGPVPNVQGVNPISVITEHARDSASELLFEFGNLRARFRCRDTGDAESQINYGPGVSFHLVRTSSAGVVTEQGFKVPPSGFTISAFEGSYEVIATAGAETLIATVQQWNSESPTDTCFASAYGFKTG